MEIKNYIFGDEGDTILTDPRLVPMNLVPLIFSLASESIELPLSIFLKAFSLAISDLCNALDGGERPTVLGGLLEDVGERACNCVIVEEEEREFV